MERKSEREVFATIRQRVREADFAYSEEATRELGEEFLSEQDVRRAAATGVLAGTFEDDQGRHYVLQGFSMNEDDIFLVCRVKYGKVRVDHVARI